MEIYEILNPDDEKGLAWFYQVARDTYHNDTVWIPQSEDFFRQTYYASKTNGLQINPVVCLDDNRPIARAASIFNPNSPEQGAIGFFEYIPEAHTSGEAILAFCENHLHRKGVTSIQAPRVDNMWMGLLVKGFDLPQTVFTPHNPPHYQQTLEASGYHEVERLVTYRFTRTSVQIPSLHLSGIFTRTFNRSQFETEVLVFHTLQNRIFSSHTGYTTRSLDEDRAMLTAFLPLLDDDLVIIAENADNEAIGLLICLPDIYQAYKGHPVTSARLISIGVLPDWKYKGTGVLMINHLVQNLLQKNYLSLEASWIKASNTLPKNLSLRFGGEPGREFALYQKDIAG